MRGDQQSIALLAAPSLRSESCAVCGRPATNQHHIVPKGMGGTSIEEGPTISLCGMGNTGGCHGNAHGVHGRIRFRYDEKRGMWWFVADDEAARAITKRGRRVRGGEHPCVSSGIEITESPQVATATASPRDEVATAVAPLADEPATASGIVKVTPQPTSCANPNDASAVVRVTPQTSPRGGEDCAADLGSRLDALRKEAETNVALRNQLDYIIGGILREAREVYAQTVPGRRAAAQEYQSWVVDTLHMSKASVSRYEQYAALEDDSAADLGISLGYEVARVVKDGLDSKESAIANAHQMSVRDFKSHYRPESDPMERVLICPDCGVVHPAALFKQGGENAN